MSQVEGGETMVPDSAPEGGQEQTSVANAGQDAAADTLLTRQDAEPTPEGEATEATKPDDAEMGKEKGDDSPDAVPDKADGYNLSFAQETNVDEGLLSSFKETAVGLGLSSKQAQGLASLYEKHVADVTAKATETQAKALVEAKKDWESQIVGRPGFKEEVADARRVLAQYGGDDLNTIMDQTLIGSHPVFFDFIVKVGKALAEPAVRGSGDGGGEKAPLVERLWPNMK